MNYVLDTNVVLYLLAGRLMGPLPTGNRYVSIITAIELQSFKQLSQADRTAILTFLAGVTVVNLDHSLEADAIAMRLSGLRLPDAVIAATALNLGAELLTHDAAMLRVPGVIASAPLVKP